MKKILSLALAGVMMFSALPMAYAADVDYTAGTAVEYTADADANRSYTITVPAKLIPKQDAAVSGTVTLKGKWASNETVKVTADAEVELTNSINAEDKHKLAITFAGIEKAGDNTEEKTYTETVSVAAMPAAALFGEWTGKFNYNVEFDDGREPAVVVYNVQYMNENGLNYVIFKEDGSAAMYTLDYPDSPTASADAGTLIYDGTNVTGGWFTGHFSEDGKTFYKHTSSTDSTVKFTFVYTP